jgi:hypothetical protein
MKTKHHPRSTIYAVLALIALISINLRAQTPTTAPNYIAQLSPSRPAAGSPEAAAQQIASSVPPLNAQIFRGIARIAELLWKDPTKAQSIVDALGEKAAPIFITYGEFIGPLMTVDPASAAKLPPIPAGYGWQIVTPPTPGGPWPAGQRSVIITAPTPTPAPTATP